MKKNFRYREKLFFLVFALCSLLLFAEGEEKKLPDEQSIFLDNKSGTPVTFSTKSENENSVPPAQSNNNNFETSFNQRQSSSISSLVQLLFALVLITVLAYIVIRFLKKSSKVFYSRDPFLKDVASINVAHGKSVHVVTIGEKAYVIGVTDSSINQIAEIDDKDLIDAMNLEAERNTASPKSDFSSWFKTFLPKNTKNYEDESLSEDFFANQHTRLNNATQRMKQKTKTYTEEEE